MHKTLLQVLAALVTTVFLIGCSEHAAEMKVDPKVLAATVEKALSTADALDNMNTKAYGLAVLGSAMAAVDPAGAAGSLDEALSIARETHSAANKAVLEELKASTAEWPAADKEQIAPALDRIEKATTRVWVARAIAEGVTKMDRAKARAVLAEAATEAAAIPDKKYRDLDLRGVAAQMAVIDVQAALGIAENIADPRIKSWALTTIGGEAAPAQAAGILAAAGEAAEAVKGMETSSELLTDATKPDVREKVLDAAKARLAAESARAMGSAALAMSRVDPEKSAAMFAKASETASGIGHPYTKAYAMSDVAMQMAEVDPQAAGSVAEKIEQGHEDARFAAMMKAARSKAMKSGSADLADLKKLQEVARAIADSYDRNKALADVGMAVVPVNKEVATEIANEIEFPELKDRVLAAVAVEWSKENDEEAKAALAKVEEPRFAKAAVLYIKGDALAEMAGIKAATDVPAALKLYNKAAGNAAEAKSTQLQWKIAAGACKLDQDKLFDMAARIEGDNYNQAKALSEVAADWSAKGNARASMVWDMAARAADGIDDNLASCELLTDIASRCSQYDRAKASAIFSMAREKAEKIGKKAEG